MKNVDIKMVALLIVVLPFLSVQTYSMGEDDPLFFINKIKNFEIYEDGNNELIEWDYEFSVSRDIQKFNFLMDAEIERKVDSKDGVREKEAEFRVQYSQAVSAYWNATVGVRKDYFSEKERQGYGWLEFGVSGLMPYFIEASLVAFAGEEGRSSIRFEMEKEFLVTQRWRFQPELELNFNGYNEKNILVGSGLSNAELGLRIFYDVTRKISPYVGIVHNQFFGNTKRYKKQDSQNKKETLILFGFSVWF
ncbi:MAG: copper resistance protein B [Cellvibrionaceae bacterium]